MKIGRKLKIIICFMLCASLMSGCSFPHINLSRASDTKTQHDISNLGGDPEFTYKVPQSSPSIEVDRLGYLPGEKKKGIFTKNKAGEEFSLVDSKSGNVVFRGKLAASKTKDGHGCVGDFSSWDKEGEYYLENEKTGCSYKFSIKKDLYDDTFKRSLKQYYLSRCGMSLTEQYAGENAHGACHMKSAYIEGTPDASLDAPGGWHVDMLGDRDVVKGCRAADILLLTYELDPGICGDDIGIPESGNGLPDILDEVKYETDWLFRMQDEKSGGVYSGITVTGASSAQTLVAGKVNMDATLEFAAAMAKFSYLYQIYDSEYATLCVKAADRAMKCASKYESDTEPSEYFMAAAELYRATGYAKYRDIVNSYLTEHDDKLDMSDDSVFRGCVTYLCTKQKVNVELCSSVISTLMDEASDISEQARHEEYLVTTYDGDDANEKMLKLTSHLAVVNYVISNHEYRTVLEDYAHYFMGRNDGAVCYAGFTDGTDIKSSDNINSKVDQNAYWVLLISELKNAETSDDK